MDLRRTVHEFVELGRAVAARLRSSEGDQLSRVDLHVLEVQLYLLGKEVSRRKEVHRPSSLDRKQPSTKKPDFPPFLMPDERPKVKE